MKKPMNLVVIWTDQQRADTLTVNGNTQIKMPNLDAFCEEAAVFRCTYVTQPVCTPSRASVMTGLYPHICEMTTNNLVLKDIYPTIVKMLPKDKYRSCYNGKWHLGNETVKQHGFDEWIATEDNYNKYYDCDEKRKVKSSYHAFLKSFGFNPDSKNGTYETFSRDFATRVPEQYSKPSFQYMEADKFIRQNKDNPFILYVNFLEPHPPYNSCFDDMYNPDEVELPDGFNLDFPENTPISYRVNRERNIHFGRMFPLLDEKSWKKLIARYNGACTLIDKYTGKIFDSLKENGLWDNTIVIFTSDHGDMMGDFKLCQKSTSHDSSCRVPLIVRIPGVSDKKLLIDEPVSTIDLVPTILEAMGEIYNGKLDGKSLMPKLMGKKDEDRDVFVQWNGEGFKKLEELAEKIDWIGESYDEINKKGSGIRRMIITRDGWKMSLSTNTDEHELYNMKENKLEVENLYYNPEYRDVVKELAQKIFKWQKEHNDFLKWDESVLNLK